MRETERVNCVTQRISINNDKAVLQTYSHETIVLAATHSFTSKRLTIESCPPEAMYLRKKALVEILEQQG
jgi:hypothetical protein